MIRAIFSPQATSISSIEIQGKRCCLLLSLPKRKKKILPEMWGTEPWTSHIQRVKAWNDWGQWETRWGKTGLDWESPWTLLSGKHRGLPRKTACFSVTFRLRCTLDLFEKYRSWASSSKIVSQCEDSLVWFQECWQAPSVILTPDILKPHSEKLRVLGKLYNSRNSVLSEYPPTSASQVASCQLIFWMNEWWR